MTRGAAALPPTATRGGHAGEAPAGQQGGGAPLPPAVRALLAAHHAGGVDAAGCRACASPCCAHGGFAILENVELIYACYVAGGLRRADHAFPAGLSFRDFVLAHFDVVQSATGRGRSRQELLFFHLRSVADDGHLVTIPEVGDYYEVRTRLFEDNPWLNRGCVFLSRRTPSWPATDEDSERGCLLHDPDCATHVTLKPVDCVFFTCAAPREFRVPEEEQSQRWFAALATAFPRSVSRFAALLTGSPAAW